MSEYTEAEKEFQESVEEAVAYIEPDTHSASLNVAVQNVCNKLKCVLDFFCNDILKNHCVIKESNSDMEIDVVHYTSIKVIFSMLENMEENEGEPKQTEKRLAPSLRLYDSIHFNDPEEGKFLISNLSKDYEWLKNNAPSNAYAYIASFISRDKEQERHAGDDLVFWRTYGKDGEGCSLLLTVTHSCLHKVFYGQQETKTTVCKLESILSHLDLLIKNDKLSDAINIKQDIAKIIWKSLEKIRYLYKSKAYEYENECRCIRTESDINKNKNGGEEIRKICYEYLDNNDAPARLRHYYEDENLKIEDILSSSRNSIMIGPCVPNHTNVEHCIKDLCNKANIECAVMTSEIPYQKF